MNAVRLSNRAAVALLALGLGLGATEAAATTLVIDLQHSTVGFRVRHLFSNVQGRFNEFEGEIEFDEENLAASSVNATIQAATVDTNVEARDKDLRSKRFFDVEEYPTITFRSTGISSVSGRKGEIAGELTIHGVPKPVVLQTEFLGKGKDPWGNERYGFTASTTIDRKDFGMTWNEVIEAGGVLVGEEVEITLEIEAVPAK